MDLDLWQKGWGGETTHWHLHSALWGESGGWKERAASCPSQSKRCSKEQILPFDWGMGAKIALIRGRLIYSLFKHLHGYFVINQTKSLIPQYPTPNISQPSLGVHASSLDTAGKLASHQRSTGTPSSQHP